MKRLLLALGLVSAPVLHIVAMPEVSTYTVTVTSNARTVTTLHGRVLVFRSQRTATVVVRRVG